MVRPTLGTIIDMVVGQLHKDCVVMVLFWSLCTIILRLFYENRKKYNVIMENRTTTPENRIVIHKTLLQIQKYNHKYNDKYIFMALFVLVALCNRSSFISMIRTVEYYSTGQLQSKKLKLFI